MSEELERWGQGVEEGSRRRVMEKLTTPALPIIGFHPAEYSRCGRGVSEPQIKVGGLFNCTHTEMSILLTREVFGGLVFCCLCVCLF